ncbi:hypothetical protein LCGC14_1101420 [marine sediment metagenome]|uniref:Uncharacterized protein n=1 Tax=marine sediment metagenome TaxID=412755 RepID=A0A0F9PSK8_9ZZZZ
MSILKAYIAKLNVNIVLIMGNHIDDITFTILDSDGVAFDFSAATGFTLKIYDDRSDTRILKVTHTQAIELAEALGVITWDAVFPTAITLFGNYNYELSYTDPEGLKIIGIGTISVI